MSTKDQIQAKFAEIKQQWHETDPSKRRIIMAVVFISIISMVIFYLGDKREKENEQKSDSWTLAYRNHADADSGRFFLDTL